LSVNLIHHPFWQSRLLRQRWLRHAGFWLGYVAFFSLVGEGDLNALGDALVAELVLLPVKMGTVYLTLYLLIPRLLLKNRLAWFALAVVGLLLLAAFLQRGMIYYVLYPLQYPGVPVGNFINLIQIIRYGLTILTVLLLASAIKIGQYWYRDQQKAKAMAKARLEAELKFLKAQIHPHFLFNTLNNLYALTLQKSDRAPEVVLRLSELVNYMLYEASASSTPLSREIETMHNYIALERIRYGEGLDIFFDVSGEINGSHLAPLLLLPFIENSFKHGVSDELAKKWISINLNVNGPHLTFKVENSRSRRSDRSDPLDYTGGIGLKNVRRRLELLYPQQYELRIHDDDGSYLVVLRLNLKALAFPLPRPLAEEIKPKARYPS
jgi:two-component system, LytTR family, sensor kinase